MTITTTTHLNFPGTAHAALEFYRGVFGGTVHVTTYGQVGMPDDAPDSDKVVFGMLERADGFRIMAYDIPQKGQPVAGSVTRQQGMTITDHPFFVSVRGQAADEVEVLWRGLSDGATLVEPFAVSEWSAGFGMLTDQFGVTWVLDVESPSV